MNAVADSQLVTKHSAAQGGVFSSADLQTAFAESRTRLPSAEGFAGSVTTRC